ncbi:hypothetical protein RO3G_12528 [Rhizopus delemar RA 99-880]|uniref:Uncharacterized protein n=1 Tax=Rhizopus delemar (strain RA 99-880 / ATCC MYA-4621 / FGSC 9543 / NRRL 43880) TaxID=246409 RepID=I1CH87_RHIO9|nr:hypothetical protein RO3G_12528 [Rhizopus delemar RA 99-880]|eukprot:EIE87817.1 hypothetical protein RO3G_12528 [Rhizopus delemar RA 99-880]
MAPVFLSENGTPLISPNPTGSRYTSLEVFKTRSMTFLLINRFVTLETTAGLSPVLTVLLENNVIKYLLTVDSYNILIKSEVRKIVMATGWVVLTFIISNICKQSKFEIVWCSIHGQAAVKHEFCNSLQQFFDLL